MLRKNTTNFGSWGEQLAARYLTEKGFSIMEANYKNDFGKRLGEIDLIAQKEGKLIFVEVKTRKKAFSSQTLPQENITRAKLYKLNRISQLYLRQHGLQNAPYQFDAVCIIYDEILKKAWIKHLENIFI